jgi:hypothetical protein
MNELISPKYQMKLIQEVEKAIWSEYASYKNVKLYIEKWHVADNDWNNTWENFHITVKDKGEIDLNQTLHNIDSETLLKIAIDLGVDTPDFIPSIPMFKNEIKSDYKTAYDTFQKAFKQTETHPDIAIGLANSALESIIKEILKDDRLKSKTKGSETLYALTSMILKEFKLSDSEALKEIKTIGNSLLTINQSIEKLRSEKTGFHGKTQDDYLIRDSIFAYFIVNTVATIGLFLSSYYKTKFPKPQPPITENDDLPF